VAAYGDFASAYSDAKRQYVPVRRAAFAAQAAEIDGMADRIAAFAQVGRPGIFSSKSRKQAYDTLKENDARAKTEHAQLAQLSKTVSEASDVEAVDAALKQAAGIKQTMSGLYASSSAAAQQAK
jgi:hypothetical protein